MIGSWISEMTKGPRKILGEGVGWIEGAGNIPGNPATRKYGYDPEAVAAAEVALLQAAPSTEGVNGQGQLVLLGIAGLGLIVLFSGRRR